MRQYRRIGKSMLIAAIAMVIAVPVLTAARQRRRERDDTSAEDTAAVVTPQETMSAVRPPDAQQRGALPATFLDSVNNGREARLSEADFAIVQPGQSGGKERGRDSAISNAQSPATAARPAGTAREVYRIQCLAATQSDGLETARNAIRTKVPYPVHIMHSPPYYKLLVGEFATRADAERALFDVRGCGYPDAWIVRGIAGEGADPGSSRQ